MNNYLRLQIIQIVLALSVVFFTPCLMAAMTLDEWLEINNATVKNYLSSIIHTEKGALVSGVRLSDDSNPFENFKFISQKFIKQNKMHIYIFENLDSDYVAYIWIDKGGEKYTLPSCEENQVKSSYPGWSGAVLSGDSYTYSEVCPGSHIVITHCVPTTLLP